MSAQIPARLFMAVWLGAMLVVAAAGARIASADTPPVASPVMVFIRNSVYYPSSLIVKTGTTVAWRNDDVQLSHTVTSTTGVFDSKNMDRGVVYSYTFTKAGKYPYTCTYHPFMKGTVIVTDDGLAPSGSGSASPAPSSYAPPPPSSGY
jgi:plastocyanin